MKERYHLLARRTKGTPDTDPGEKHWSAMSTPVGDSVDQTGLEPKAVTGPIVSPDPNPMHS